MLIRTRKFGRYLEMYPNRRQPDFKIFRNLYDRLGETGSLRPRRNNGRRPKIITPEQEEKILVMAITYFSYNVYCRNRGISTLDPKAHREGCSKYNSKN